MKIAQNSFVSIAYKLTVDGQIADSADATRPLEFIFGTGMLIPKFEENLAGKAAGDKFVFTLTPAEGYGETYKEAIVELPKNIFEIEGKFDGEIIKVGEILPMMDNEGNQMPGRVEVVTEDTVTMNFNHPMAGKTLNFEGEVIGVREATDEDMSQFMGGAGGCGCGCGCDDDCECEDGGSCDCGCDEKKGCNN